MLKGHDYFLPSTALSTVALVLLLGLWHRASVSLGGLRDDSSRERAGAHLKALLAGCCAGDFDVGLSFAEDWEPRWPRPELPYDVSLRVSSSGTVDLSPWRKAIVDNAMATNSRHVSMVKWFKAIRKACSEDGNSIRLEDLVWGPGVCTSSVLGVAWNQIVWQLGLRLEAVVLESKTLTDCDYIVKAAEAEISEDWSSRKIDEECMKHRETARRVATFHFLFGVAADEVGCARGLDLCNAALVLPTNVAFELVPQVVWS